MYDPPSVTYGKPGPITPIEKMPIYQEVFRIWPCDQDLDCKSRMTAMGCTFGHVVIAAIGMVSRSLKAAVSIGSRFGGHRLKLTRAC